MKQGEVDRLDGFLSENSPPKHRDLASLILKNVLLEIYSVNPDGMYLDITRILYKKFQNSNFYMKAKMNYGSSHGGLYR